MYDTSGSYSVCRSAPSDDDLAWRLNWLKGELTVGKQERRKPSRIAGEWRALRSVALDPSLTTEEAYAWFGTFLGLFPPFAMFARFLGVAFIHQIPRRLPTADAFLYWALLFLLMNAVCCFVGRKIGASIGRSVGDPRTRSWPAFILLSLVLAFAWGIVTGAAGGAVAFLVGAVVGVVCAVPVALAALPVFAVLHRALSRGGMIEEQRLWPLAFGIPLTIAAMIIGPGLFLN
jgi:hypothetical protein